MINFGGIVGRGLTKGNVSKRGGKTFVTEGFDNVGNKGEVVVIRINAIGRGERLILL